MEMWFYSFWFVIALILFFFSLVYHPWDYQMSGIMSLISGIMFLALVPQAFHIETQIAFNQTSGNFSSTVLGSSANGGHESLEAFVPFGISMILSIFSFLNVFIIFTAKAWNKATKGMEMPEGFKKF